MDSKKDSIIKNLGRLNDIAYSNAASTEETSAMTEELTEMINMSSTEVQNLSSEFDVLIDNINNFTFK